VAANRTGQVAQTSRGPIDYTLRGAGPAVLICHGTSSDCYSTEMTDPLADAGFGVLTPARPGYGRTPLSAGRTAAQAAEALVMLLDCCQVRTCAVVAISGGGPTGIALAAGFPDRVTRLVLAAAVSRPENRPQEVAYRNQAAFYGPLHSLMWSGLGLMSKLAPRALARQTLAIFSTHDALDGLGQLSTEDVEKLCQFYRGRSSRLGALNDATHTVGAEQLDAVRQPTLVIHSRDDAVVPFSHADWSRQHIAHAELVEAGITGHFLWIGPDSRRISRQLVAFLRPDSFTGSRAKSEKGS
jgi:pimeloyl-ACP methyl ester carboxylesterase